MMRFIRVALALALLAPAGAAAQSPFSAELRVGAGIPAQDFGTAELGTGIGGELTLLYQLPLCLQLYAGWDWYHFGTETEAPEYDFEDTGYAAGLRWTPVRLSRFLGPWLRAGIVFDHIEMEDDQGDLVSDSDHTLGFEGGLGLTLPLGERFRLTPGVRYRTFAPEMQVGSVTADAEDFSYIAVEVGIATTF